MSQPVSFLERSSVFIKKLPKRVKGSFTGEKADYNIFVKSAYIFVILGYLITLVLPMFTKRRFELYYGVVNQISSEKVFLFESNDIYSGFEGALGIIALVMILISVFWLIFSLVIIQRNIRPMKAPGLSLIFGIFAYLIIDFERSNYVERSYDEDFSFYNVIPYGIGLYVLLVVIFLNFITIRMNPTKTFPDARRELKETTIKISKWGFGPTLIQIVSIHFASLILMMFHYGYHEGFGNAYKGPQYYTELFLTFGLNRFVEDEIPAIFLSVPLSFIIAPMIVLILGVMFFFLQGAGFAPNGPGVEITGPEGEFWQRQDAIRMHEWAYFSKDLPGAENYLMDNPKLNSFYIVVIFLSLFVGAVIGALINFYLFSTKVQPKIFSYLRFFAISCWFVSVLTSVFSAPVYVLPVGIFFSILVDKDTNFFVRYKWLKIHDADNGYYHPLSTWWGLMIFWLAMTIVLISINFIITHLVKGDLFAKKESIFIKGKFHDESETDLPFVKD
ncbi:MAG: hypothetical protein ACXAD7_16860 [Candidatus Kariarchaeaceae archaeon]